MKKRILPAVLSIALLLAALMLAQAVLVPSRYDNREGHLLCGYYDVSDKHDVIFVGDCEIYESFVPAILWEEYATLYYISVLRDISNGILSGVDTRRNGSIAQQCTYIH